VGEAIKIVREKGEQLCRRLLPTVPIPMSSQNRRWTPPQERATLSYLFELLKVITGIATIFESARVNQLLSERTLLYIVLFCLRKHQVPNHSKAYDSYLLELTISIHIHTYIYCFLFVCFFGHTKSDHPLLLPSILTADYMHSRLSSISSSPPTAAKDVTCFTPNRIPFEPSIDRETNCLFLGGGAIVHLKHCAFKIKNKQ
jgi:hypothetical protein